MMINYIDSNNIPTLNFYNRDTPDDSEITFHWKDVDYPYRHKHKFWEFFVVLEGSLIHEINNKENILSKGDIALIRPNDIHAMYFKNENLQAKYINFSFKMDYFKNLLDCYGSNIFSDLEQKEELPTISISELELKEIINKVLSFHSFDMQEEKRHFELRLLTNKIINILLDKLYCKKQQLPHWLINFLLILSNPQIQTNVIELAKNTPYSYSRLAPIFKQYTGRTIIEYINITKLNYSKELLTNTTLSIGDICHKLNFTSVSYFIRTFKKEFGFPPFEFRKNNK